MLRFINIQVFDVGMYSAIDSNGNVRWLRANEYINGPQLKPSFYVKRVRATVVDTDKQKELCKMWFELDGFGSKLLNSKGEERTKLTTITGELERIIRERYDK